MSDSGTDDPGREIVIVAQDLHRTFQVRRRAGRWRRESRPVRAVDGLSFEIGRGESVGLIGPNGAGKSKTVKMLTGILVPTSGRLRVAGMDPTSRRTDLARRIGVVFGQRTGLWWDLPLRDSFGLLLRIYRIPESTYKQNVATFTELLDLGELLDRPVRGLSLGERMRGDIAAALLHDPEILYLDEPTIGLDLISKSRLRAFLRTLNAERRTTILLTTHDLVDIEQVCRRVLVIDHGRLVVDETVDELRRRGASGRGVARTLVIDLATARAAVEVEGARVVRVDGPRQWLELDPGVANAGSVVGRIAAAYDLVDLTVKEPTIEDVITRLYSER